MQIVLECAFCGKSPEAVRKIIVAPRYGSPHPAANPVGVCDECVAMLVKIVAKDNKDWLEKTYADARDFEPGKPENSN